ncbi:hypothetical protein QOL99_07485, partial [Deinococcus sp. MIMF12]
MFPHTPARLRPGLLTLALLLGGAGAERTVAPTPLYTSPDLRGSPVETLPSGTPLTAPLGWQPGEAGQKPVLTVLWEDRVLYARSGTVASTGTGVNLSGRVPYSGYVEPQPAGGPVSVFLSRDPRTAAGRVGAWQVRVLPLDAARLDGAGLNA